MDGYGVSSYDQVAYYTEGDSAFTATHEDVTYRFSSVENRDRFVKDQNAYAPQYGSYCAFGTAIGRKFSGDPTA